MNAEDATAALERALARISPDAWRRQRWFGAKDREVSQVSLVDVGWLRPGLGLAIVEVEFDEGSAQVCQLPIALARASSPSGAVDLFALEESTELWRAIFESCGDSVEFLGLHGTFRFARAEASGTDDWPAYVSSRDLGADQSNSARVVNEAFLVKLFRQPQFADVPNPELEIAAELRGKGFSSTPGFHGSIEYESPRGLMTLAVLQDFLPLPLDGWTHALEVLAREGPGVAWVELCRALGVVTGKLHRALAEPSGSTSFDAVDLTFDDIAGLCDAARDQAHSLAFPELASFVSERQEQIERGTDALGKRIRVHGDYHLGQVVLSHGELFVVDFEGEPSVSLELRRRRYSPLKDVAGMLRSFDYAVATSMAAGDLVPGDGQDVSEFRRDIVTQAEGAFLDAYDEELRTQAGLLPSGRSRDAILELFEIEKALYELVYEQQNRPEMVDVPRSYLVNRVRALS